MNNWPARQQDPDDGPWYWIFGAGAVVLAVLTWVAMGRSAQGEESYVRDVTVIVFDRGGPAVDRVVYLSWQRQMIEIRRTGEHGRTTFAAAPRGSIIKVQKCRPKQRQVFSSGAYVFFDEAMREGQEEIRNAEPWWATDTQDLLLRDELPWDDFW